MRITPSGISVRIGPFRFYFKLYKGTRRKPRRGGFDI